MKEETFRIERLVRHVDGGKDSVQGREGTMDGARH